MRKIILDKQTQTVVNIIEIEEGIDFPLPLDQEFGPDGPGDIGDKLVNGVYTNDKPKPVEITIEDVQKFKIGQTWNNMIKAVENDYVAITTSAGKHNYGIDKDTRDNIQMALIGVLAGIITQPRNWSPKGEIEPIQITTQEIGLIAGTIGKCYDQYIQAYFVHKATIKLLQTKEEVLAYDNNTNWPVLEK